MVRAMRRAVFLVLLSCAAGAAPAGEGYSIERQVIAGGGGTSSGAGYVLRGTLAQAVAGPSGQGGHEAWSGFWRPQSAAPAGTAIFRDGFER